MAKINAPLTVPPNQRAIWQKNYQLAMGKNKKLFLFAGDQKVEHLNGDFEGKGIDKSDSNPEHLFQIASLAPIGVFAAQLGLISRYGAKYQNINYIVKLNSKTNLNQTNDPLSLSLASIDDILAFKKNNPKLKILGIGMTVYIGNNEEAIMLKQAAQAVLQAQKQGLLTILWIYPRGKQIKNDEDIDLLAGAAGVGLCLGADFVKVKYPYTGKASIAKEYQKVTKAAGTCGVICAGGDKLPTKELLKNIDQQIHLANTAGIALGRNLHQHSLKDAISIAKAIQKILQRK